MPCYHPKMAWRSPRILSAKSGKPRVFFRRPPSFRLKVVDGMPAFVKRDFVLPDGAEEFPIPGCKPKCIGCQEAYSRSWAVRCLHESKTHDQNCFITLTFNDKFCPKDGSLDHRYFQLFMKRFRRTVGQAERVRYFMAGEYGSQFGRPHYHACIFGFDFPDRKMWTIRRDVQLDTSEMLSRLWSDPKTGESYGFCSVGDVTFASAAYIARYISKKMTGDKAEAHYQGRRPEYVRMSLKPGVARKWINGYIQSVYPDDSVVLPGGFKCKPPRYYDKVFELTDPRMSSIILTNRKDRARKSPDNTPERLRAREVVKEAQFKMLRRSL